MKIHPSITADTIVEAVERANLTLDNPGFCIACGHENEGCEPDMRKGVCESCNAPAVYGAEELLFRIM